MVGLAGLTGLGLADQGHLCGFGNLKAEELQELLVELEREVPAFAGKQGADAEEARRFLGVGCLGAGFALGCGCHDAVALDAKARPPGREP